MEKDSLQFKKKRDPERFEQAQHDIAELIGQAQAGEIELAYVDEAQGYLIKIKYSLNHMVTIGKKMLKKRVKNVTT